MLILIFAQLLKVLTYLTAVHNLTILTYLMGPTILLVLIWAVGKLPKEKSEEEPSIILDGETLKSYNLTQTLTKIIFIILVTYVKVKVLILALIMLLGKTEH